MSGIKLKAAFYLRYDFDDGETRRTLPDTESAMRKQWLLQVRAHQRSGYDYIPLSETSGCFVRRGETINVELVKVQR